MTTVLLRLSLAWGCTDGIYDNVISPCCVMWDCLLSPYMYITCTLLLIVVVFWPVDRCMFSGTYYWLQRIHSCIFAASVGFQLPTACMYGTMQLFV